MNLKQYIFILFVLISFATKAQFYNGYAQKFGKNRIQFTEFTWKHYDFKKYNVYFYKKGETNANYIAKIATDVIKKTEERFDYYLEEKVEFVLFNKQSEYRQTNIEIENDKQYDIGGVTRIQNTKVFLYFDGNHQHLEEQMKAGVANIIIHRLILGENWKEIAKNSTMLTIPNWYIDGLVSYYSRGNSKLVEDQIKDGVITGRYREFNHLSDAEAIFAGHAIWSYVAKTYGEKVIPNILYMSRLSRNIESGFLYVIGLSLKSLNKETIAYHKAHYLDKEKYGDFPETSIDIKQRKNKRYSQLKVSPDGKFIVYVENENGKYNVILHEIETKISTKILTGGYSTSWMPDYTYPILQWHPTSESITIVTEKKARNNITFYNLQEKEKITKPLFKLERVLDIAYAPNGKTMVISAVKNGQTDLYQYNVVSNHQKQLTNDIYDDINPSFLTDSKLIFSSNRYDDTLRTTKTIEPVAPSFDLFIMNITSRKNVLKRVTNTPFVNETQALRKDTANFIYLSDETKITGRNIAHFDSVISHIDTAFHYRYVTVTTPMSNYSRNIIAHHYSSTEDKIVQLFFKNGTYFMNYESLNKPNIKEKILPQIKEKNNKDGVNNQRTTVHQNTLEYSLIPIGKKKKPEVDYNNYVFDNHQKPKTKIITEKPSLPPRKKTSTKKGTTKPIKKTQITSIETPTPFKLPVARKYIERFAVIDAQLQLNFNYATDMYQRYTGNLGYMNTKVGMESYATMTDIFNNHEITAGARVSLNFNIKEYYIKYTNRKNRLNKQYSIERQTNEFPIASDKYKLEYNQAQMRLNYPLNEKLSIRGTNSLRYDRFLKLSTEKNALQTSTTTETLMGLKAEVVYDNTTFLALNLRKGTRFKLFAETYNGVFNGVYNEQTSVGNLSMITPTLRIKPVTIILGLDYRKYIKLHRNIIWANRFVASTSLGENKLLYYLGGVDNKIHLGDKSRFNHNLPVIDGQAYNFQTISTNMRGFLQNSRNGNNLLLISSELRIPVFNYFAITPLKSDFIKNFQTVVFTDIGTAWGGKNPYSDDNYFNTTTIGGQGGDPVKVILRNQDEPIIAGYGFGIRSRFLGYFMKFDIAWGLEDGQINAPKSYLSVGLDF